MTGASAVDWMSIPNAMDTKPLSKNKGLQKLYFLTSIMFMSEFLCGYDGTILGSLQALPSWQADLNYPVGARLGLLNAISFIAGFVISPFISQMSDRWGRRIPLLLYGYTMLIGTLLGCVAGTTSGNGGYGLFIASKFVIGAGMQAGLTTCIIFLQETLHPRNRAYIAGYFDVNWAFASMITSWVCFGCSYIKSSWAWRIPYLIQVVFALYICIAVHFVPDSPRWLLAKGRDEEALAWLIKYHGDGDENDELVHFEFAEMKAAHIAERAASGTSWPEVLKAPGNKHRFILAALTTLAPQLCGSSIIEFYYTTILNLVGITGASVQTGINCGLTGFQTICQIFGVLSLRKFKRRSMVLYSWPGMIVCLAIIMGLNARFAQSGQTDHTSGNAVIAFIFLFGAFQNYSGPLFYSYPGEILNTTVRAKGMVVWSLANQASGCFSSFVNSIGLQKITWKFYAVYVVWDIVWYGLLWYFMVETHGLTLEEVAIVFEGEAAGAAKADAEYIQAHTAGGEKESLENGEKEKVSPSQSAILPALSA